MALFAYNKTVGALALPTASPVTTLPLASAASVAGTRGAAVNVTSELRSLSQPQYTAIQDLVNAGSVEFEWSNLPEYSVYPLMVGSSDAEFGENDIDFWLSTSGNDASQGTAVSVPLLTMAKAQDLKPSVWYKHLRMNIGAGTFPIKGGLSLSGGPKGLNASPETWIGTRADSGLGTLAVGSATTLHITASSTPVPFRSGAGASITAVSGGAAASRTATVTGLTGMVAGDVNKYLFMSLATNQGNNGHFQIASVISATSVTIYSANGVVENTGLIYWQDSYRGGTLVFSKPTRVTCVAVASLVNNDNFTVNRNGYRTVFEYKVNGSYSPVAGRVTIDVSALGDPSSTGVAVATAAAIQSNDSTYITATPAAAVVTIAGIKPHVIVVVTEAVANAGFVVVNSIPVQNSRIVGHGAVSLGKITSTTGANIADTETFTINDGTNAATVFEFDSGGGVTPGNIAIAYAGTETAAQMAALIATAINARAPTTLRVRAYNSTGSAEVQLENMIPGVSGNQAITDTVANAGFVVAGFADGLGTPLTTFSLPNGSPLVAAPVAADQFTVELPATVLEFEGIADAANGPVTGIPIARLEGVGDTNLGVIDCIFRTKAGTTNLQVGGMSINPLGLVVDCLGGNLECRENTNLGPFPGPWIGDPTNPFFRAGSAQGSMFVPRTNLAQIGGATNGRCTLIVDNTVMRLQQNSFMNAMVVDSQRVTFRFQYGSTLGNGNIFTCDGSLQTAHLGLFWFEGGSRGAMVGDTSTYIIKRSSTAGIAVADGSNVQLGDVRGWGHARAGVWLDKASVGSGDAPDINQAAPAVRTSIMGATGAWEFGHATTPNVQSYATMRTADASGQRGYPAPTDTAILGYCNRADFATTTPAAPPSNWLSGA